MAIIQAPGGGWELLVETLLNKERLAQSKEAQKQHERDLKLREDEAAFNQGQMQSALQTLLMGVQSGDPFAQDFVRANVQLGAALRDQQLSTEELQNPALLGATRSLGEARTAFDERVTRAFRQRVATATPAEARALSASAPPQALAQADIRDSLTRLTDEQTRLERNSRIVNSVEDPKQREAISLMLEWTDATDTQRAALFPELFSTGVEDSTINSIVDTAMLSGLPIGDIRRTYGVDAALPGLPDDFRFPTTGASLNESRQRMTFYGTSLNFWGDELDDMEAAQGGISLTSAAYRELLTATSTSSGLVGLAESGLANVANWVNGLGENGEQQRLVTAQLNWANAFRYLQSGMATTDREFGIILRSSMANLGDTPATVAIKAAFRHTIEQTSDAIASGDLTRLEGLSEVRNQAVLSLGNLQNTQPDIQAQYDTLLSDFMGMLDGMAQAAPAADSVGPLIPNATTGDPAIDLQTVRDLINSVRRGRP